MPSASCSGAAPHRKGPSLRPFSKKPGQISRAITSGNSAKSSTTETFAAKAAEQVQRALFPEVIRLLDKEYGRVDYSLTSLFTDEQRRIVQLILNSTLWDIENSLTTIYQDHASLLH